MAREMTFGEFCAAVIGWFQGKRPPAGEGVESTDQPIYIPPSDNAGSCDSGDSSSGDSCASD